jgi:hypothetical protein
MMLGSPWYACLKCMQTQSFHLRESKDKSIPWHGWVDGFVHGG